MSISENNTGNYVKKDYAQNAVSLLTTQIIGILNAPNVLSNRITFLKETMQNINRRTLKKINENEIEDEQNMNALTAEPNLIRIGENLLNAQIVESGTIPSRLVFNPWLECYEEIMD